MNNNLIEKILYDINYPINEKTKEIINKSIKQVENDFEYVWSKIDVLKEKIAHVKGYVGFSNSGEGFKITYDNDSVSDQISKEFYDIVNDWSNKYKIKLAYNYENEAFYIR
jgi:hypothetical protein